MSRTLKITAWSCSLLSAGLYCALIFHLLPKAYEWSLFGFHLGLAIAGAVTGILSLKGPKWWLQLLPLALALYFVKIQLL